jgi:hypothetical protein
MIEKIAIAILAATFSGLLTWSVALRRHRTNHWWNIKLDVYVSTLNCLHQLKKICLELLDDNNQTEKERFKDLILDFRKHKYELEKYKDLGYLLLSENAEEVLIDLIVNLEVSSKENQIVTDDHETDIEIYEADENLINIDKCISLFKDISKDDLQV